MKIPNPPLTDEETSRHVFYGSISSSLECLNDRLDNDDELIKDNTNALYDKYHQLKTSLEDIHVRINRRVYTDEFDLLREDVHILTQKEIAHRTAWATGKTFIIGAWIVFALLFGWATTLTQKNFDTYIQTIQDNTKVTGTLQTKVVNLENKLMESKIYHDEKSKVLDALEEQTDYLEDTIKTQYSNINKLNSQVNKLENRLDAKIN